MTEYINKQAHKDLYDSGNIRCLHCCLRFESGAWYDCRNDMQMISQTQDYTEYRCTSCGYVMKFDNNVTTTIPKLEDNP